MDDTKRRRPDPPKPAATIDDDPEDQVSETKPLPPVGDVQE